MRAGASPVRRRPAAPAGSCRPGPGAPSLRPAALPRGIRRAVRPRAPRLGARCAATRNAQRLSWTRRIGSCSSAGRCPFGARAASLRNVDSPIASSTSPRPTKSSRKFVPEDRVTADVSNSFRLGAQDASDRRALLVPSCAGGVVRVRPLFACLRVGSRVGVETERAGWSVGSDAGVEVTAAVTVVEAAVDARAAGAGSGRIEARAGEGDRSGAGDPWAIALPVTPPKTTPQARRPIPCCSLFEPILTIRPSPVGRDGVTVPLFTRGGDLALSASARRRAPRSRRLPPARPGCC